MEGLLAGLQLRQAELGEEEGRTARRITLAKYFVKSVNTHNVWAARYCAILLYSYIVPAG